MRTIIAFIKKEAVLTAALLLAIISSFLVPPSARYVEYIDFHTLSLLFGLMVIMAGYQDIGLFRSIGQALLGVTKSTLGLVSVLVFLPFFLSMIITNDVALITFVPFALTVLRMGHRENQIVPVVVLQTIAANLGSMMLPMGNPQNLYLYAKSGISLGSFVLVMLPYTVLSAILLMICCFVVGKRSAGTACLSENSAQVTQSESGVAGSSESSSRSGPAAPVQTKPLIVYTLLFIVAFCAIMKVCSPYVLFGVVLVYCLICDRKLLGRVDYSLLLTFIGFFIFIGNMKQLPAFNDFFARVVTGHETPVAVIASQIISNVPAALLLSGFTDDYRALVIGTNLGGLGTLIASMASLISFKQIAREVPEAKGKYFGLFTASNIVFLILLMLEWWIF